MRSRYGDAALIVGVAILSALQSAAADRHRYRRAAVGGMEKVIAIGTRFNKACQNIGVPQVILDAPPEHGFVCIRNGTVQPHNLVFGNAVQCLDKPMNGVQLIYRSRAGFFGRDEVGYTLKFPRGDRSYLVEVMVKAPGATTQDSLLMSDRQPTGIIPECMALVS